MNIVFVSSEVAPFAKTGGLADVAGSLPKALRELGHNVFVFMPRYRNIEKKSYKIKPVTKRIRLRMGKGTKEFNIYSSTLTKSDVPIYFIDKELYFCRPEIYHENGVEYSDNAERFHYFNLAVLESLKVLDIKPDVIHCNDWQTAIIPLYLKTVLKEDEFYQNTKTVYTIHNLAYQGVYEPDTLDELKMPTELYNQDNLEFWGKVNFTKGAIIYADAINTVSRKYAAEIQTKDYGCGLEGVLQQHSAKISGITNGLDYDVWNPETDKKLKKNFGRDSLELKTENKKELLRMLNLPYDETKPVIGLISRLVDQKGFDLISKKLDELCNLNAQLVVLATGDPKYEQQLRDYQAKYPEVLSVHFKYDNDLAQMIYGGSDMFLMPSHFEPCGLGQLISLKYGSVPVVRATGGLADTIKDIDQDASKGNGFVFTDYTSTELLQTVQRAINYFQNKKDLWKYIQMNGMKTDFSWKNSAGVYSELYEKVAEKELVPA